MPEILHAIERIPGTRIIYHRASLGRLYIVPEENNGSRYDGGDPGREP
ncbi:MAG: hypothetical protein SA339_07170 [Methanomassiliicoccus sp.]|nr:hypothetical protein [Methanomassiliicoccus sp.]